MFEFSDEYIARLLRDIYEGRVTRYSLPSSLYFAIGEYLKKGLYKGFGLDPDKGYNIGNMPDGKDWELLEELRENVYMFSAAKTYQQTREMTDLLVDGDNVRSFQDFKEEALKVFEQYNVNWLQAEYNTALAQADMAVKWQSIQDNKDILPILSYSTVETACPICSPLDGLTLPADDDMWDTIYPPNHFNCMCIVTQHEDATLTDKSEAKEIYERVNDAMADTFKMNSGKDKYIFSPESPYFTHVPKEDRGFAKENFGLPIPEDEI